MIIYTVTIRLFVTVITPLFYIELFYIYQTENGRKLERHC